MGWRSKKRSKGSEPADDRWVFGFGDVGDGVRALRINSSLDSIDVRKANPLWTTVSASINAPRADGMPDKAEGAQLSTLEDRIVAGTEAKGRARLAMVVTGKARRDFWLCASNLEWARKWARDLQDATSTHKLSVLGPEDPHWSMYSKVLHLAREGAQDLRLIEELKQRTDLNQPRTIRYHLRLPSSQAEEARKTLDAHDYRTELQAAPEGVSVVIASHARYVTPDLVAQVRRDLGQYVSSLGGEFEGWDAAV